MILIAGYAVSILAFLLSFGTDSREVLILALSMGAATTLWSSIVFIMDFPRRPITDLLAGSLGAGLLGGAVPQNITYLDASRLLADSAQLGQAAADVRGLSLAGLLVLACCATLKGIGLVPNLRRWLTPPFRPVGEDAANDLTAFLLSVPIVAVCLWMVATGIVSVDKSPYTDGASDAVKKLGALYLFVFGLLPAIPAVMARYIAPQGRAWLVRLAAASITLAAAAALFVVGRRVLFSSLIAFAVVFAFERGWRIGLIAMMACVAAIVPLFLVTSTIFLAARQAQSSQRSVSVAEMIRTGQLETGGDQIDAKTRVASRAAFLGELADLIEKLPVYGASRGMASVSAVGMLVPDALWSGKENFKDNIFWDDSKIETAAGNSPGFQEGDHFKRADIADTLITLSWVDVGIAAPVWCAVQMLVFFGCITLVGRIIRIGLLQTVNYCAAMAFCLVPDATSSATYLNDLRQIIFVLVAIVPLYLFSKVVVGFFSPRSRPAEYRYGRQKRHSSMLAR